MKWSIENHLFDIDADRGLVILRLNVPRKLRFTPVHRKWFHLLRIGSILDRDTPILITLEPTCHSCCPGKAQAASQVSHWWSWPGCNKVSSWFSPWSKKPQNLTRGKNLKNHPPQNSCNFWSLFKGLAAAVRLFCIDRLRADEPKIKGRRWH